MPHFVQSAATASRSIVDVSWFDLAWAFGLILIAIGIARWQGLGLAQRMFIGALRTIVQLMLVGYVLVYIFALDKQLRCVIQRFARVALEAQSRLP